MCFIKCALVPNNTQHLSKCSSSLVSSFSSGLFKSSVQISHWCIGDISSPQFGHFSSLVSLDGVREREISPWLEVEPSFSGVFCRSLCLCPLCTFKHCSVWEVYSQILQANLMVLTELASTSVFTMTLASTDTLLVSLCSTA